MLLNDNDRRKHGTVSEDAHGPAALLLVESLIHGLCESSTLSPNQAVEIAERAVDVQFDQAEAAEGAAAPLWYSHGLLLNIAASLRVDVQDGPAPISLV